MQISKIDGLMMVLRLYEIKEYCLQKGMPLDKVLNYIIVSAARFTSMSSEHKDLRDLIKDMEISELSAHKLNGVKMNMQESYNINDICCKGKLVGKRMEELKWEKLSANKGEDFFADIKDDKPFEPPSDMKSIFGFLDL